MQQRVHTCDSCDRTAVDTTRRELEKQEGWHWKALKNSLRTFVICGDCWAYYERIWAEKAKAKVAA